MPAGVSLRTPSNAYDAVAPRSILCCRQLAPQAFSHECPQALTLTQHNAVLKSSRQYEIAAALKEIAHRECNPYSSIVVVSGSVNETLLRCIKTSRSQNRPICQANQTLTVCQ
jgi:hypothetical protein